VGAVHEKEKGRLEKRARKTSYEVAEEHEKRKTEKLRRFAGGVRKGVENTPGRANLEMEGGDLLGKTNQRERNSRRINENKREDRTA